MRTRRCSERKDTLGRCLRTTVAALGSVLLAPVIAPADRASADAGQRHGLRGDYYLSAPDTYGQFTTHKATVVDPVVDFDDLGPVLAVLTGQQHLATVRWTGRIRPRYSETYTFFMVGDNGFRLWVANTLIIDHWVDDWNNPQTSTPITLRAGHSYDIRVEYFEHFGGSNLHLSWSSPSQRKETVPNAALYLPPRFTYAGPLSSTVAASGRTVALTFGTAMRPLPAGLAEHFRLSVNGTDWPIASVGLNPRAPQTVLLRLADPVPHHAGNNVRASYDGLGGVTTTDGTLLPAFNTAVLNYSAFQITTPWAETVTPDNALPEYPRPQLVRERWQNLNGEWQYQAGSASQSEPPSGDLSERTLVPYPPESLLSGIRRHDDHMWYRRTITVPESWRIGRHCRHPDPCQRLILHFGAVDYEATVWVNGVPVITHTGGYDSFTADITDAVTGPGPQVLLVKAVDQTDAGPRNQPIGKQRSRPGGIWYASSSGIWQTVWMEPVPAVHINRLDMIPDLANNALTLTVHASGVTDERVEATAWHGTTEVGSVVGPAGTALALPVPNAELWSPDHPFLYDLKVQLVTRDGTLDRADSYFGMRSVSIGDLNGQPHILLNGAFLYNIGTLDQGYWPDGLYTAPTDDALRFDLRQQKALGFNTVRKHVKVEPDRWYSWADRMGLMVWQDMPAMNLDRPVSAADKTQFEAELRSMVQQHLSHPSIIMWIPFNEGWGEYDPLRIAGEVKAWDPSRLVNENSGQNCCLSLPDPHGGDSYDDHTYPGPGHPVPIDHRAVVDGEFGGLGLKVAGHMWSGSGFAYEMENSAAQLTDRYAQLNGQLTADVRSALSGSIYTQPYDVEGEVNGLMTYDRRILKPDPDRIRAANAAVLAAAAPGSTGL